MSIISRSTVWNSGDTLTASALNAEFDNILTDHNGGITNANIATNAAIAYSKLSLTGSIKNADIASDAAIASTKLNLSINRAFTWFLPDTEIVRNEAGAKYIVPQNMTGVKVWFQCDSGTATIRIQKDTTDVVNSLSVSSTQGSTTSLSSGALTAGQVLSLDITAASSPKGIAVTFETTQP